MKKGCKKVMEKNKLSTWGYKLFKPFLSPLFKLYYNPKIINSKVIPKDGNILIVGNHKHVFDQCSIIISTKRIIHFMAKKEYFEGKLAWFFKITGCISVDRNTHDGKAKNIAIKVLKNGGAIGLFPEGTRNKTNNKLLLDFKYGTVSMANKTNSIIIPYAITGDYKFRSKNLMIRFGTPFKANDNLELANKKLYEEIEKLMKENLKATNRSLKEELNSRGQDKKTCRNK